jgi:hypothetical protein
VPAVVVLSFFISLTFQPVECGDVTSCRQAALDAQSRSDFELFHDLAWRAMQKGPRNDPELMTLLARAQSLSGRPGDALVMLRRLAQLGASVDLGNDDFQRVRALPAWPELAALFERGKPADNAAASPKSAERQEARVRQGQSGNTGRRASQGRRSSARRDGLARTGWVGL